MAGVFISVPGEDAVMTAQGGLAGWAERSALRRVGSLATGGSVPGRLRFVFYGWVPAGDWQDPVTSGAAAGNRPRHWYPATRGVGRVGAGRKAYEEMRYHAMVAHISAFLCRMAADLSFLGTGFMVLIP